MQIARAFCAVALGLTGCPSSQGFACEDDHQCVQSGQAGVCQANAFCSFPDADCPSGHRYSEHSSHFSGLCVGENENPGGTQGTDNGATSYTPINEPETGGEETSGEGTTTTASGPSLTTGNEDADSTESSGTDGPPNMTLRNHNGECETGNGVACLSSGDYVGDNHTQECFESPLELPFSLLSARYYVGNVDEALSDFRLQVRPGSEGAPSERQVLFEVPLEADDATPGWHTFVLSQPLEITEAEFCVGIAAPEDGPGGGVGIAADSNSLLVSGRSYFRSSRCGLETFVDIMSLDNVSPQQGNWCIDVEVGN
ncbi:MAG: hypothetical protein ACRBN8_43500 [Nannocystales bacterium]